MGKIKKTISQKEIGDIPIMNPNGGNLFILGILLFLNYSSMMIEPASGFQPI
jgi:hypothetical protein